MSYVLCTMMFVLLNDATPLSLIEYWTRSNAKFHMLDRPQISPGRRGQAKMCDLTTLWGLLTKDIIMHISIYYPYTYIVSHINIRETINRIVFVKM